LLFILAFAFFFFDFLLKIMIDHFIPPATSIPIVKGFLHLTYVQNTGAAFGILPNQRPLLVLIGVVVCVVIIYLFKDTKPSELLLRLGYGAVLGGSLSNLLDRIIHGYVIDYIDFRIFPVFNFGDVAINLGVFFIILDILLRRKECTR